MDRRMKKIIERWADEAGVHIPIMVGALPGYRNVLKIITDSPGLMIGRHGKLISKYRDIIKKDFDRVGLVEIVETDGEIIHRKKKSALQSRTIHKKCV